MIAPSVDDIIEKTLYKSDILWIHFLHIPFYSKSLLVLAFQFNILSLFFNMLLYPSE
jgi:hypothetical protein